MDWPDFGWNVAVEFIGLVVGVPITIFVIAWLIRKREEKRWKDLKSLIKEDMLYNTADAIMSIRCALHISWHEALQINLLDEVSDEEKNKRVTQFGKELTRNFEDSYKERLLQMASSDWNTLFRNFAEFHNGINHTFSMYAGYLKPKLAEHLILVRNRLFGVLRVYRTVSEDFDRSLEQISHDSTLVQARTFIVDEIHSLVIDVLALRSYVEKLQ